MAGTKRGIRLPLRLWIGVGLGQSPDSINALPEPLRRYIHDLETNAGPAGMVRENIILRAERDALLAKVSEFSKKGGGTVAPTKRRQ